MSIVVVNFNGAALLGPCLDAIAIAQAELGEASELIIVDNASSDGSRSVIADHAPLSTVLVQESNIGFAGGVEVARSVARGEWIVLVNNDAELEPTCLRRFLACGRAGDRIGAVTGPIVFHRRPDIVNSAGLGVDCLGVSFERRAGRRTATAVPADVFGASGCVVAYRMSMLDAIGGFDASFFAYGEDTDVAWRARMAGWRTVLDGVVCARHHGSATAGDGSSFKYFLVGRNRVRLIAKNATLGRLLLLGWAMLLYDVAYIAYVATFDRTLSPAAGRLAGLREWRAYRASGRSTRRRTRLGPPVGPIRAHRMRSAYRSWAGPPRASRDVSARPLAR